MSIPISQCVISHCNMQYCVLRLPAGLSYSITLISYGL